VDVDERIDRTHWIVSVHVVVKNRRKQRALRTILPLDESRHPSPRRFSREFIARMEFSHMG
jgi:hypothetical protein